jgi:hypothetical protein
MHPVEDASGFVDVVPRGDRSAATSGTPGASRCSARYETEGVLRPALMRPARRAALNGSALLLSWDTAVKITAPRRLPSVVRGPGRRADGMMSDESGAGGRSRCPTPPAARPSEPGAPPRRRRRRRSRRRRQRARRPGDGRAARSPPARSPPAPASGPIRRLPGAVRRLVRFRLARSRPAGRRSAGSGRCCSPATSPWALPAQRRGHAAAGAARRAARGHEGGRRALVTTVGAVASDRRDRGRRCPRRTAPAAATAAATRGSSVAR